VAKTSLLSGTKSVEARGTEATPFPVLIIERNRDPIATLGNHTYRYVHAASGRSTTKFLLRVKEGYTLEV
jgi:hypothetical protein